MHFQINREAILKPLQIVGGAIEKRHTMPILSNILMNLEGNTLQLTGTDLEVALVAKVQVDQALEPGAVALPVRKLMDLFRALPDNANLDCHLTDNKFIIASGRSRCSLATLPASDFPALDETLSIASFSLPSRVLQELMTKTSFSMAQQDVRYYLNGMLFIFYANQLRAVSTDGHRLATYLIDTDPIPVRQPLYLIIPRKGVLELNRLLQEAQDDVAIRLTKNHFCVTAHHYSFTTKLIEGRFPDYAQVLPAKNEYRAVIPREKFKQSLQRVAVLFSDKHRGAGLQFSRNTLKILAKNSDKDEVEEIVEIDYQDKELEIGFNIHYLLEYVSNSKSDAIVITFTDANASVLFEESGDRQKAWQYVVMPMLL